MSETCHGADGHLRGGGITVRRGFGSRFSVELILGGLALLLGIALLVSFYLVTRHAVAQAHTHWARVSQGDPGCGSAAAVAGDRCGSKPATSVEGLVVSQAAR